MRLLDFRFFLSHLSINNLKKIPPKIMHQFKKLSVWQKARSFTKDVYVISQSLPKEETLGLVQQMRRAAISITSNIAEGCGRSTNLQLVHFLNIAQGSAFELESQLYISFDLEYFEEPVLNDALCKLEEIQKMIIDLNCKIFVWSNKMDFGIKQGAFCSR